MIEIKTGNIPCCVFLSDVSEQNRCKTEFLNFVKSSPVFSAYIKDEVRVYNTDYYIKDTDYCKSYHEYFYPIFNAHLASLSDYLKYVTPLSIDKVWFQQYKKNDFHTWHTHGFSLFSSIYYLELPNESSKTTFRFLGKEFQVEVKEGQILTFPSFLEHCSKPNPSEHIKTIIAFNSN